MSITQKRLWIAMIIDEQLKDPFAIGDKLPLPKHHLLFYKDEGYSVIGQEEDIRLLAEGARTLNMQVREGPREAYKEEIEQTAEFYRKNPDSRMNTVDDILSWLSTGMDQEQREQMTLMEFVEHVLHAGSSSAVTMLETVDGHRVEWQRTTYSGDREGFDYFSVLFNGHRNEPVVMDHEVDDDRVNEITACIAPGMSPTDIVGKAWRE